jgi:hypothetical protein
MGQTDAEDVFSVGLDQCNLVLAKPLKKSLCLRPVNKDRAEARIGGSIPPLAKSSDYQ